MIDELTSSDAAPGYRHEALLYAGEAEFLAATVPFITAGLSRNEPVMVAVSARKIDMLKANLGWDASWVDFVDMARLGTNPGRIISAWRRFLFDHRDDAHLRGIGEPIWAERNPAELIECQQHEMLLNDAFPPERPWRLLCPYDTSTLDPTVIEKARHAHPFVQHGAQSGPSLSYRGDVEGHAALHQTDLPEPEATWQELAFDAGSRSDVLALVAAAVAHLPEPRADGLIRSVAEVTENSIRHGGGRGTVRVWSEGRDVVCEISDSGHIDDPLVGRGLPATAATNRRGLWLVHELCDLVQLRSSAPGTVVRMTLRADHR